MCSGENGAPHAVDYMNAQYAALHESAKKCLKEHSNARTEENKYSYVLAEYAEQKPGTPDDAFSATFDTPQLEFICDHDALLCLTLTAGFDGAEASPNEQQKELPSKLHMVYRVGFEQRNEIKVGDYVRALGVIIFDFKNPTLVTTKPDAINDWNSVVHHLAKYLSVLQDCGHHILVSLPQFDLRRTPMPIDFSLMDSKQNMTRDIHGITAQDIDYYMSSAWVKSVMLVRSRDIPDICTHTDWRVVSLDEFSTSASGIEEFGQFQLKMKPSNVEILCAKEVIMYFNIEWAEFFNEKNEKPTRRFQGWRIAIVVDVIYNSQDAGKGASLMLDLPRARYHVIKSEYPDAEGHDDQAKKFKSQLVLFFSKEYLHILESAGYHTIYSHSGILEDPPAPPVPPKEGAGIWPNSFQRQDEVGVRARETIQHTKMHGFDQVTAISQTSLNAQFVALCATQKSIFREWEHDGFFKAIFHPMSLHLLSSNSAIIRVHMLGGYLKTLVDWEPHKDDIQHSFGDWQLAFKVELRMCSHNELEGSDSASYKNSAAYKKHGDATDLDLRHIYLDLRRAEFLHDHSDLFDSAGSNGKSVLQLQAVVYYITRHYFPAICQNAQHVVSSVPVWKAEGTSRPPYALTDVTFHVYSNIDITSKNCSHVAPDMEPVIVVLGMTGSRPLPSDHLNFSTGWVVQGNKGFTYGTISISKRAFIEERLLTLLSRVKDLTTMIPEGFRREALGGISELVPWNKLALHQDQTCQSGPEQIRTEKSLQYLWETREWWEHVHSEGSSDVTSRTQSVSCVTCNYVELPLSVREGALHIKVGGEVKLNLKMNFCGTKLYTASSSVSWSANVSMQTTSKGIKVSTPESYGHPIFAEAEFSEGALEMFNNPTEMLVHAFPERVDLRELIQEVNAFGGVWQHHYPLENAYSLCHPVFNDDGDLLFELRRRT